jgi:hypothetical protein
MPTHRFCTAVKNAKGILPQQRIGQIIVNALDDKTDVFYVEDEVLCSAIEKYIKLYEEEEK